MSEGVLWYVAGILLLAAAAGFVQWHSWQVKRRRGAHRADPGELCKHARWTDDVHYTNDRRTTGYIIRRCQDCGYPLELRASAR